MFNLRPAIRTATAADAAKAAELIATASAGLRSVTYLVPERGQRHRVLTGGFLISVEQGIEQGEVHMIGSGAHWPVARHALIHTTSASLSPRGSQTGGHGSSCG